MSSYYSSFNYLGINSRSKNLVVAHFDADSGESETFLNIEPIYTDSASGIRRLDYGAKYGSVAIFRINVIKPDGNDFSVIEIRDCLKWLTGSISNSTLDLLIGDQIKYSFIGRITNVWQYKMDAKTVGLILEFTSASPFAYSPKQSISCSVSGTKTLQIHCPSDDLNSYVYMQTTYENISGTSLTIENITTEDKTEVSELATNEIITIDNNIMITSDKQGKMFGNTFNFCFPRLTSGINNLVITANGNITFEYSYPIKIGDLAIDTDELNGAIDCDGSAGTGTVATEYILWENILNKPPTVSESSTNFYTKDEVDTILLGKLDRTDAYDKTYLDKALKNKLDKMPFDTVLTENSPNYVTSGTVYSAINSAKSEVITAADTMLDDYDETVIQRINLKADKTDVYTKAEIDTQLSVKADRATTLSGYGITDAYTKQTIDNTINLTNNILNNKLDKMEFDDVPTKSSPNYLTSGAVYNAITAKDFISTVNIQNGAITLSKLSDDLQTLINSGGSGGNNNFTKTLTGKYIISIADGAVNGTPLSVMQYVDSTEPVTTKYYFSHYNGSANVYDEMKEKDGTYIFFTNSTYLKNNMKFKLTSSNAEGSADNPSTCISKNSPTITISDSAAALGVKVEIEPEYGDITISGTDRTIFKIAFIPSTNNAVTGEIIVSLSDMQFNSVGLIGTIDGSSDWNRESYEFEYFDGVWSVIITFTGGTNDFKARANDNENISFGGSSSIFAVVIDEQDLNIMLDEVLG